MDGRISFPAFVFTNTIHFLMHGRILFQLFIFTQYNLCMDAFYFNYLHSPNTINAWMDFISTIHIHAIELVCMHVQTQRLQEENPDCM